MVKHDSKILRQGVDGGSGNGHGGIERGVKGGKGGGKLGDDLKKADLEGPPGPPLYPESLLED